MRLHGNLWKAKMSLPSMHFFFVWPIRLHKEKNASKADLNEKPSFYRQKTKPVLITGERPEDVKRLTSPSTIY